MTSDTEEPIAIHYEGPAPSFGGFDSADFAIDRPGRHVLEVNLRLALDARARFDAALAEAGRSALDADGAQGVLRGLAQLEYGEGEGEVDPPAIRTLRAWDIEPASVDAILTEAGLL